MNKLFSFSSFTLLMVISLATFSLAVHTAVRDSGILCEDGEWACPTNTSICIPDYWVCDNYVDCPDGEDEKQDCAACDQFSCDDGLKCVQPEYVCDFFPDCKDGADESQETCTAPCDDNQFECSSGWCLPVERKCDSYADCENDEIGCPCDGLQCVSDGACISRDRECDRKIDCADATDELNCICDEETEFDCEVCINAKWICDYVVDCPNGADEGDHCNYTMPRVPHPHSLDLHTDLSARKSKMLWPYVKSSYNSHVSRFRNPKFLQL